MWNEVFLQVRLADQWSILHIHPVHHPVFSWRQTARPVMYNKGNESYSYDANFYTKIIVAQLIVGNFCQVSATLRNLKKIPQTPFTMILNIYLESQNKIIVSITIIRSSRKSYQQRVFKSKAVPLWHLTWRKGRQIGTVIISIQSHAGI